MKWISVLAAALVLVAALGGAAFADDVDVTGVNVRVVEAESPRGPVVTDSPTPFTLVLLEDETAVLEAIVTPSDASDQVVSWSIEDEDVVSLSTSSEATITAMGIGYTEVTVATRDGGFTDSITVIVTDDLEKVLGEADEPEETQPARATPPTGGENTGFFLSAGLFLAGLALWVCRNFYRCRA